LDLGSGDHGEDSARMSYEFRILGPVELSHDHRPVQLGSAKRRAMLTALALDANRPVSLTRLADALWAGTPPASATANLRSHAAALRRVLGDRLVARVRAYELRIEPGELDAAEFARLATAGRSALAGGDLPTAIARLGTALALWRGSMGDGLPRGTALDARLTALDEQRLEVYEDYVQARLMSHPDPDLAAELRRHLGQNPLRERAWGQLMLLLYRSGNVAAALAAYGEARAALSEQLGIEPGQELAALQRAILHRDPALDDAGAGVGPAGTIGTAPPAPPATFTTPQAVSAIPRQLPPDVGRLVGRTVELAGLVEVLREARAGTGPSVVMVSGRGGVGKSALAVRAGHLLADEFRDGQIAVDLRGTDPHLPPRTPDDVVGQVLRAFGVPPAEVPHTADERAARYRSLVTGRRMLLLLEDAATATQVRPLVPGGAGGTLLVTGRRPLATLDGAARLEIAPLAPDAATELLAEYVGEARLAEDPASAAQLVRLCAGLPLALRIVAARLASRPSWPLNLLAAQLADHPLDGLQFEDLSVRDRFAVDYLAMAAEDELAARSFRLLGTQAGGSATPQAAAAQLHEPAGLVFHALEQLVDARLADSPRPGHYRVPDLLRLYAAELAADDDPRAVPVSAAVRSGDCPAGTPTNPRIPGARHQ